MKDTLMLDFYRQQTRLDGDVFARWRAWCIDHAEQTGTYPEFIGRLKRCQQAQQRHRTP